jgi:hypothetical protein
MEPECLRQRSHLIQRAQQAQWSLLHTTVNPVADPLKLNGQNLWTNLLVKPLRCSQRSKISMLAQPKPGSEGVVPVAEDLCAAAVNDRNFRSARALSRMSVVSA